jgi:hypothetical protein
VFKTGFYENETNFVVNNGNVNFCIDGVYKEMNDLKIKIYG